MALRLAVPEEPLWIDADAARFAQLLGNLLSNALKFTPPGGHVELAAGRGADRCEVRVRDDGQGLDPAELERIFDPFEQGARATGGGLGLGLALVRRIAAKHRGEVSARSDGPGRGAEFLLTVPLAEAPPAHAAPGAPERPGDALRILLVEDNADAAETLAELLALHGHRVRVAATGRAALALCAAEPPDAIVCDLGLPDMSGHEVIRAVRAGAHGRAPFAVALTGYAQPQDREEALAAGFDAHLAKPPPLERLEALLRRPARPGWNG